MHALMTDQTVGKARTNVRVCDERDCPHVRDTFTRSSVAETYTGKVPVHLARKDVVHRDLELDRQNAEDEENGNRWPLRIDGGANGGFAQPGPDFDQQTL